jgi:hypothetical protein
MAKSGWHKSGDWSLDRLSFDGATVIVVFRIGYQSKKWVAQKRECLYVAFPIDATLASNSKQYKGMTENFVAQKRVWDFGSFKFYTKPLQLIFAPYIMAKSWWHKSGDVPMWHFRLTPVFHRSV